MDKAIEKLKGPAKLGGKKFEPNEIEIKVRHELCYALIHTTMHSVLYNFSSEAL